MSANAKECPDCAGAPVNHTLQRFNLGFEWLSNRLFEPLDKLRRRFSQIVQPLGLGELLHQLPYFLVRLRLAKFVSEPEPQDTYRTRVLWESAKSRGINLRKVKISGFDASLFAAEYRGQRHAFMFLPRPKGMASESYDWMDNKAVLKTKFQKQGFPLARGGVCRTQTQAKAVFKKLQKPVVVKPMLGSRSRHTTIHVNDEPALISAFSTARKICPWVVIEEQLSGTVFRITLIGGKVFAVLRREAPFVIGDGRSTVRQLVEAENKKPARQGPIFHAIPVDRDLDQELQRQDLSLQEVPAAGRVVTLNQKIGRSTGGSNTDVTDQVHPDNLRLFHAIGLFLDDPLVGIDFIIEDIGRSWTDQPRCGVIECNAMPFIDLHHYPMSGAPRDAAGALWDIVFPSNTTSDSSKL